MEVARWWARSLTGACVRWRGRASERMERNAHGRGGRRFIGRGGRTRVRCRPCLVDSTYGALAPWAERVRRRQPDLILVSRDGIHVRGQSFLFLFLCFFRFPIVHGLFSLSFISIFSFNLFLFFFSFHVFLLLSLYFFYSVRCLYLFFISY
jgi:hypothetical protein